MRDCRAPCDLSALTIRCFGRRLSAALCEGWSAEDATYIYVHGCVEVPASPNLVMNAFAGQLVSARSLLLSSASGDALEDGSCSICWQT